MSDRVYVSDLHGCASDNSYDYARSINEGTHVVVRFVIYDEPDEGGEQGWTSYEVVMPNEELLEILKDRAEVRVQKPVSLGIRRPEGIERRRM